MIAAAAAGLATGLSLIVAIGAQNAFVLRQGLARRHVGPVVAVCALSDVVLIAAGVVGIGTIVESAPVVLTVLRWLGVAFLAAYGVRSLLSARRADGLEAAAGDITYYSPWGNLAIFYKGFDYAPGLVRLGALTTGIDDLPQMSGPVTIRTVARQ